MKVRLGEIGKVITGNTPKTSDERNYSSNDICFVKPSDITDKEVTKLVSSEFYISEHAREKARILPPKSVLVTCIGIIGKVAINDVECAFNQQINAIIPDQEKCLPEYLAYSIQQKQPEMQDIANAPVVPILNKTQFSNIEIEVPCLQEQQIIIDKLDAICDLVALRKQQLAKLDELVKSRFVEMFGNKGENPNEYPQEVLGNLYKFQYGKGNNIPEDKGEYPCYGSNGIVGHHVEFNSEDSPIIGHIGAYAGIVNWGEGKHYVTYNGVICKLKTDTLNPIYGFHLLQQQDFNRVATKGGGQPFVSYGDLEAPIVVVPPLAIQEKYAEFAKQVDKSKLTIQQSLDKLETLKKALMQEYFG